MKNIDLITMNEVLEKYIIPDFMNGYRRLENLIMKLEVESEDTEGCLLIEKRDLAGFNHIWKAAPAKFVEIIAVAWVSAVEDNVLMLMRTGKNKKVEKGSNSTPLTQKQKSCQYCHELHKPIEAEDGSFLRIGMSGGNGWDGVYPEKIDGAAIHTCNAVGFDNAEVDDPIVINYCPICGRRLAAK